MDRECSFHITMGNMRVAAERGSPTDFTLRFERRCPSTDQWISCASFGHNDLTVFAELAVSAAAFIEARLSREASGNGPQTLPGVDRGFAKCNRATTT
jgi:hypothetical protein